MPAQRDPVHGGALHCGGAPDGHSAASSSAASASRGPAALLPVRAVGPARCRPAARRPGWSRRPAARGVLGHPGFDQRPQRLGHRLQRHRLGQMLVQQLLGGIPAERRPPGQALIKRGRGRVHVPGRAGRTAAELLRRRVRQRPRRHRPVPGPRRDAEIRQLARTRPVDQHVLRLVIPVHHPPRGAPPPAPAATPAAPPAPPPPWSCPDGPGSPAARPPRRAPSRSPPRPATRTYSYSRTTFGSSTEASTSASPRNITANSGSASSSRRRYLIATSVPDTSCRASTTSPNPPEPSGVHLGVSGNIPLPRHQVPTHRPPTLTLASGRRQSPARAPVQPESGRGKPPPDDWLSMSRAQAPCQSPDRGLAARSRF